MSAPQLPGSLMVAADAQFSTVQVVKPFPGFETVYQGQPYSRPIVFPGVRDPQAAANDPAFDPNLLAGISVPLGARLLVWIPVAVRDAVVTPYRYTFVWRYRNTHDFRVRRISYHFPRQSPGAPDAGAPRFVLPSANDTIIYEQPEPVLPFNSGVQNVRDQVYRIGDGGGQGNPLLPNGVDGIFQQGVLDPAVSGPVATDPIFQPLWMDAQGDEMIILAYTDADRNPPPAGTWDFAGVDRPFSNIYGTDNGAHPGLPDVGIYIVTGSNP